MNIQPEKRRHKRIGLEHLDIQARTVFSAAGEILDVSLNGACLSTTQWLPINNDYAIGFYLDGKFFSHTGTVRWVKLVGTKKGADHDAIPIYTTGLEFTTVLTDDGKDIMNVLHTFSENRGQRLSGKRLKLAPPVKAIFPVLKECQIKQISSGGMLIETDLEFSPGESYYWAFNFPGQDRLVRCHGKIISRTGTSDKNRHTFGIAFSNMLSEDRKNLARFIMEAMFSGEKAVLLN